MLFLSGCSAISNATGLNLDGINISNITGMLKSISEEEINSSLKQIEIAAVAASLTADAGLTSDSNILYVGDIAFKTRKKMENYRIKKHRCLG